MFAHRLVRNQQVRRRRGGALLATLPVVIVLAALGAALLSTTLSHSSEQNAQLRQRRAQLLAEASAQRAIGLLELATDEGTDPPAEVGTEAAPVVWQQGRTWASIDELDDGLYEVRSFARIGSSVRMVEVVVQAPEMPLYDYAIFAGNSSGDADYELRLSGVGAEADSIQGSIYSGGDLLLDGDSFVTGDVHASGTVGGGAGVEGMSQPIPDIAGMDYRNNNDFDVASMFNSSSYESDDAGGDADQMPDGNPAHIFRRNPSNRSSQWTTTVKEDYYLEDPYEPMATDPNEDGSDPYVVTFTGGTGNDKVFYIDGNLWVDNWTTLSFQFRNEDGSPVRATFVVEGNIIFGDNIFYQDPTQDAVAFIAIEDPDVPDSGNILFGDERCGTLNYMSGFMYAENDFVDFSLDQDGSKDVTVFGNMTAGNHVAIERDYEHSDGTTSHSQLTILFDDRISTGMIDMVGLPSADPERTELETRMWRRGGHAAGAAHYEPSSQ